MLSLFPSLFDFGMLAPTLLRLVAGIIFIDIGYFSIKREASTWGLLVKLMGCKSPMLWRKLFGSIEFIGGTLILVGLYMQGAVLVLGLLTLFKLMLEYKEPTFVKRDLAFYVMLFTITISLLILGAGAFAFDLPL